MRSTRGLAFLVLGVSILGCADAAYRYAEGDDPEFPRLVLADRSLSVNDRCPVKLSRLSRKIDPVYVNGRAIGFC